MTENIRQVYQRVSEAYFPRWYAAPGWRARAVASERLAPWWGFCDFWRDSIYVAREMEDRQRLISLFHEICHAVTGGGHGKRFQRRMRLAAGRADELGDHALASELRKNAVEHNTDGDELRNHNTLYSEIEDEVLTEPTPRTYSQVREYYRRRYFAGIYVGDFDRKYPRARPVYEAALNKRKRLAPRRRISRV